MAGKANLAGAASAVNPGAVVGVALVAGVVAVVMNNSNKSGGTQRVKITSTTMAKKPTTKAQKAYMEADIMAAEAMLTYETAQGAANRAKAEAEKASAIAAAFVSHI